MKKCPDCKIELTKNYIKQPERLHAKDLSGVLDQIWAEEICKKSNMKSR